MTQYPDNMIPFIKKSFRFFIITSVVVGAIALAVVGLGIADQGLFGEVYITGNTIADHYDSSVPVAWFHLAEQLVRETPGFSSPVAARAFGYMGVTLYEAIAPGMPGYQPLAGQLNGLQLIETSKPGSLRHWPTVANAALADITRRLFPTATSQNLKAIDALEAQFDAKFHAEIRSDVFSQSQAHGRLVARRIFEWSMDDGGHEAYLKEQNDNRLALSGSAALQPSAPEFDKALLPDWRANRPFALTSSIECLAAPPPIYSTERNSEFYYEAMEIYKTAKNLSELQRSAALFWADEPVITSTPAGHAIAITTQVLQQENASLAMAAITYSKVGMAAADAFIGSWEAKYTYNRIRPISYIRELIDPEWNTPALNAPALDKSMQTPTYPAYTSEQATVTTAAMSVLSDLFGTHYEFSDYSHVDRGFAPRAYPSFMAAAEEAALSQFYAGIDYRSDVEDGAKQGACIGEKVNGLRYLRGFFTR